MYIFYLVTFAFLALFVAFSLIRACLAVLRGCTPLVFAFVCFYGADNLQSSKLSQFELQVAS